jgi:hypothetical protein
MWLAVRRTHLNYVAGYAQQITDKTTELTGLTNKMKRTVMGRLGAKT